MKKFRFTLAPVSTLRDLQEMRAREGLAAATRRVAAGAAALAQQQLRVAQCVEELVQRRSTGLPGTMLASFMRAFQEELVLERSAGAALDHAREERESARKRWIETHLQVKLIEKLRGRAFGRHVTEAARQEQRQLDERSPRGHPFSPVS